MHACGHDAHTAMLLTAALVLKGQESRLPGTVKFIFQPDEEGSGGARRVIAQGVFRNPKVQSVYGLHVNPRLPAGTVGIKAGPLMAAVDRFTVEVFGGGGHGAYPHEGTDAVYVASQVVNVLQSLVSRRVDPVEPVVVTVGTFHGGRCFNILADRAVLTGTVRTLTPEWHRKVQALFKETVSGIVKTLGGRCRIAYERLSPALVNTPDRAALARETVRRLLGPGRVIRLDRPSMGGEDFSEYLAQAPGCFLYMGTGADGKTRRPWHHPEFVLHEPSMLTGVKVLCALAVEDLKCAEGGRVC
jgi:amidohydrolase